ncbi:unnamed protein product, partial [Phaeothamnion confervicola]
ALAFIEASSLGVWYGATLRLSAADFAQWAYFGTRSRELTAVTDGVGGASAAAAAGSSSAYHLQQQRDALGAASRVATNSWLAGVGEDGVVRLWRVHDIPSADDWSAPQAVEVAALPLLAASLLGGAPAGAGGSAV